MTLSPLFLSTGKLSPVSIASSTELAPSITLPSKGIFSPGRTTIISPTIIFSTFIFTSSPLRITFAVFGARLINAAIAPEVLSLETASKYLPSVISVKITPADS